MKVIVEPRAQAIVGEHVYTAAGCVPGEVGISDRTQIASAVQVLSGSYQHGSDSTGMMDLEHGTFPRVTIEVGMAGPTMLPPLPQARAV
jgi:hypothetical protein